jgi:hypothetical protein
MIDYMFYLREPGYGSSWKCGISAVSNVRNRLGNYQTAIGPERTAVFNHVFLGSEFNIRKLEEKFKLRFASKILSVSIGNSEWISYTTEQELLAAVKFYREDYLIKCEPLPSNMLPLTPDNMAEFHSTVTALNLMVS